MPSPTAEGKTPFRLIRITAFHKSLLFLLRGDVEEENGNK